MNYGSMTDLKINYEIASVLFDTIYGDTGCIVFAGERDQAYPNGYDFCNNPADMWPIILDNGICLTSPVLGRKTKYWSATWNADGGSWTIPDFACGDDNPLRAAAIVFLMMKDMTE